MNQITEDKLKMLEAQHWQEKAKASRTKSRLRVFYGFAKTAKVRKREGISIVFENEEGVADHHRMGNVLPKIQETVCWRYQTDAEAKDAQQINRVFTEYMVYFDDKKINWSLERALRANSDADKNNVSKEERKRIEEELRRWYLQEHRDYKEPIRQLEIEFPEI